ncbi:aminoacyl-tRNA hydrolase [Heliobacillus mobilis]
MKAIVGLGNPGRDYEKTRHNIGFMVVDQLAERWGHDGFKAKFQGSFSEVRLGGQKVFLLKPQTYMNLSGQAASAMAAFYKLAPEDILVVYDDLDLPPGKLRGRTKGSSGGHNGIKSLIACLGSENFPRLKLGIGRPASRQPSASYVLESFRAEELADIQKAIDLACDAVELWLERGMIEVMNRFNGGEKA